MKNETIRLLLQAKRLADSAASLAYHGDILGAEGTAADAARLIAESLKNEGFTDPKPYKKPYQVTYERHLDEVERRLESSPYKNAALLCTRNLVEVDHVLTFLTAIGERYDVSPEVMERVVAKVLGKHKRWQSAGFQTAMRRAFDPIGNDPEGDEGFPKDPADPFAEKKK